MKFPRWIGVLAVGAGMLAGGCGSDDDDGSGSGSDSDSGKKSEVVIGTIGSYSAPGAGSIAGSRLVLENWVKMVNEAGGLDGHPVKLVVKDDGGDAAKALNQVKEMVVRDKVVAIVGQSSFQDAAWGKYIEGQGIPVVGGAPYSPSFVTNAGFYSIGTSLVAQNYGVMAEAKKFGDTFANLYCAEAPVCAVAAEIEKEFAPKLGVKLAVAQKVAGSLPNYTAVCKAVKDSGAQSYTVTNSAAAGIKISEDCVDVGVKAENITTGGEANVTWLKRPKLDGTRNVEVVAPYFDDSTEGTKGYRDFVAKYLPGFDKDGADSQYAYISGELLEAAIKAAPADKITSETIKKGLYALKDETLGGLTAPLNYTEGKPNLIDCWFISQIEDGKWTTPDGLEPQCAPDGVVEPVAAKIFGGQ